MQFCASSGWLHVHVFAAAVAVVLSYPAGTKAGFATAQMTREAAALKRGTHKQPSWLLLRSIGVTASRRLRTLYSFSTLPNETGQRFKYRQMRLSRHSPL